MLITNINEINKTKLNTRLLIVIQKRTLYLFKSQVFNKKNPIISNGVEYMDNENVKKGEGKKNNKDGSLICKE